MNSSQNQPFAQVLENSEPTIKRDLRALRRERTVRLEDAGEWSGDPFEQLREAMAPVQFQCVKTGEAPTPEGWRDAGLEVVPGSVEWDVEALERNLYGDREGFAAMLREAMEPAAREVVEDLERLRRPVFVGTNVSIGYVTEEPQPVVAFDWPLEGSHSFTATQQLVGLTNHPKVARGGAGGGRRAILMLGLALEACGRSLNDIIVIGGGRGQPSRLSQIDYAMFDDCSPQVEPLSVHPGDRHRQLSRNLTSSRSRAGKAARWSS